MQAPSVDIHIMSHNRSWSLLQTVASIREFTKWPYHITVQDHASIPRECRHIKRLAGPDCNVVNLGNFLSCNEGRRVGLDRLGGPYIVYLDDDCRVAPGWLTKMMGIMLTRPRAGVVTCSIMHDGNRMESGVRNREGGYITREAWGYLGQGIASLGGATLYRRLALERTVFRPQYNAGFEDWDQTLQITQDHGFQVWGSDAGILHCHQADSGPYKANRWRWHVAPCMLLV